MKRRWVILAAVLVVALSLAAWKAAVPPVVGDVGASSVVAAGDSIAITGAVTVDANGRLIVGGYPVIPVTSDVPPTLHSGDLVIVLGTLQADGQTIYAESITLYNDSLSTLPTFVPPTPIGLPTVIPATFTAPLVIGTPTGANRPVSDQDDNGCDHDGQPEAQRIADAFNVSYDSVIQMHCDGNGFGEITRAFALQTQTGISAWTYLQQHKNGVGWGQIMHDADIQPSDLAPGKVISQGNKCEDGNGPPGQCKKLDDKPGHPNGPPGPPDDHGGPGNGNGQGHGRGHDKDH